MFSMHADYPDASDPGGIQQRHKLHKVTANKVEHLSLYEKTN